VKTFYCMEDIERLAAQGKTELIVDENTVLTDLARDMARQLGISLVYPSRSRPVAVVPSVSASGPLFGATAGLGAKPKGCQHGPLEGSQPQQATVSSGSSVVVDQLVDLVKQLGDECSGS
jgi:hypothetical protein